MRGAVGVEPAQVEQGRVKVAAVERAEQIAAAGDQMGDVVDQPSLVEGHQDGVAERSAFDRNAKSGEIADAGDLAVARLGAEHDRQRRIDVGLARRQHAERNPPAAIVAGGALEIRAVLRS